MDQLVMTMAHRMYRDRMQRLGRDAPAWQDLPEGTDDSDNWQCRRFWIDAAEIAAEALNCG